MKMNMSSKAGGEKEERGEKFEDRCPIGPLTNRLERSNSARPQKLSNRGSLVDSALTNMADFFN